MADAGPAERRGGRERCECEDVLGPGWLRGAFWKEECLVVYAVRWECESAGDFVCGGESHHGGGAEV